MFFDHTGVLARHFPTAELDYSRTGGHMSVVQGSSLHIISLGRNSALNFFQIKNSILLSSLKIKIQKINGNQDDNGRR
jgi:hypothetical protein